MVKTMTPNDCAKYVAIHPQAIREALKAGTCPFGFATNAGGNRWNYHIIATRFFEYIREDIPNEWKGQEQ